MVKSMPAAKTALKSALRELAAAAPGETAAADSTNLAGADAGLCAAEAGTAAEATTAPTGAHSRSATDGHAAAAEVRGSSAAGTTPHLGQGRACNCDRQGQGGRPQNTEFRHCASPKNIWSRTSALI